MHRIFSNKNLAFSQISMMNVIIKQKLPNILLHSGTEFLVGYFDMNTHLKEENKEQKK